jgi:hypothetical protein
MNLYDRIERRERRLINLKAVALEILACLTMGAAATVLFALYCMWGIN